MTLINVISSAIYLKGFPLKTKIQLYGMALFFLVFLYTSPSGLVFYWTLNNLFSLGKTLFYKIKKPSKSNEKAFFKEVSPNKNYFWRVLLFLRFWLDYLFHLHLLRHRLKNLLIQAIFIIHYGIC